MAVIIITLNNGYRYKNAEETLSTVMNQRMEIINKASVGELNEEDAYQLLEKILDNPLLQMDADYLKEISEYPTDMDVIRDMNILEINDLRFKKDIMTFDAHVVWIVDGLLDRYVEENIYSFQFKKYKNGSYKLVDYQVIL